MSKNSEWTQQAEISLGAALTTTSVGTGAATKRKTASNIEPITQVDSSVREELLKLVQRLFLTPGQALPKTVMFAASGAETGCTRVCAVTADLLAESVSGSVCLVEGNFRAPSLADMFGVDNHRGLADSLRQEGAIRGFATQVGRDNLWLLSSGSQPADCLNLLSGDRMKERLAELRSAFDYVLIDAPPLNSYADAMVFGRLADGVVLVLEANATRREAALQVAESLRSAKISVLGAVLNKRTFPIPSALYKRL
jgi:Mrp family chromosome partitioning ATPase